MAAQQEAWKATQMQAIPPSSGQASIWHFQTPYMSLFHQSWPWEGAELSQYKGTLEKHTATTHVQEQIGRYMNCCQVLQMRFSCITLQPAL